jgi:antirestriction protein ArdC
MRSTANRRSGPSRRASKRSGQADRADRPRADLYEEVTRRIVGELEAGRLPWVQPWGRGPGTAAAGLPRNALTGRSYSGINILILWGAGVERGYPSQGWLTFRQALAAGGAVRKGERGTSVVYADRFVPEAEKRRARETGEGDGEQASLRGSDDRRSRAVPFLKRFTVFNVAQCDGLPGDLATDPAPVPEREIVPVAEAVIAASGVSFRVGGSQAFYAPGADVVQVPPQPAFFEQINYYRTCLHELTHATGHRSRLARDITGRFGSESYAREELVAEMGSAFLGAALGIQPTVRHADYIASWLDVLRTDKRAIVRAASQASKAADWLLARHRAWREARADAASEAA